MLFCILTLFYAYDVILKYDEDVFQLSKTYGCVLATQD